MARQVAQIGRYGETITEYSPEEFALLRWPGGDIPALFLPETGKFYLWDRGYAYHVDAAQALLSSMFDIAWKPKNDHDYAPIYARGWIRLYYSQRIVRLAGYLSPQWALLQEALMPALAAHPNLQVSLDENAPDLPDKAYAAVRNIDTLAEFVQTPSFLEGAQAKRRGLEFITDPFKRLRAGLDLPPAASAPWPEWGLSSGANPGIVSNPPMQDYGVNWLEYVGRSPILTAAVEVLSTLSQYGKAYIVGGAVRDIVTGEKDPDDIDIATNVPMDTIESLFPTHDIGANKDFGILVIEYGGFSFEVAQFRRDGTYYDGRRPDTVEIVMELRTDVERRDFTINALAVDAAGNVIDYFDGAGDIKNKILRAVGDPEKRFGEDYLRMLRAVRFASRMGYEIEPATASAIRSHAGQISNIAKERITNEIVKMASQSGDRFAQAIMLLRDTGLLEHILPEVLKMDEFEHTAASHPEGNVYEHTLAALRSSKAADPIINLAILLHDVGKIDTQGFSEEGIVNYIGHVEAGMKRIDQIADRMRLDNETRIALIFATENHMKMHDILKMSDSKIVQLMLDKNWDVLYQVGLADARARGELFSQEEWAALDEKIAFLREKFASKQEHDKIKKIVGGKLLMSMYPERAPGPWMSQAINSAVDWIINNDVDISDMAAIKQFISVTMR